MGLPVYRAGHIVMNIPSYLITKFSNDNSGLVANTTYYWKVVAKDNQGNSTPGEVCNFKTGSRSGGNEIIFVQQPVMV